MPCPYGKRQQCKFEGFGQSRQQGCLAAQSKANKGPRTFSRADEFVDGLRGMLRGAVLGGKLRSASERAAAI